MHGGRVSKFNGQGVSASGGNGPANRMPATGAGDHRALRDGSAGGSVLIVDDNHSVTRALEVLMRRAGFEAIACYSGGDAMAYAQQNAAPTAVVVDIPLPDINGLILAQKLRGVFGPAT